MGEASKDGRRRYLLVVAGSGRSGTSLFTGLTNRLGFHIPQPEARANETNPRGFGEPIWALKFHKKMIKASGISHGDGRPDAIERAARVGARPWPRRYLAEWLTTQFELGDRVVVKDPRLFWFVELYQTVAADLGADFGVVTMLRSPAETIRSHQNNYLDLNVSTRVSTWINASLSVERVTRDTHRALVQYDDLLADWRGTLAAAESRLGTALTSGAPAEQLAAADDLVDPSLRRSKPGWDDFDVPEAWESLATRTYESLTALGTAPDAEHAAAAMAALDEHQAEYVHEYRVATAFVHSAITAARDGERRRVLKEIEEGESPNGDEPLPTVPPTPEERLRRLAGKVRARASAARRKAVG